MDERGTHSYVRRSFGGVKRAGLVYDDIAEKRYARENLVEAWSGAHILRAFSIKARATLIFLI